MSRSKKREMAGSAKWGAVGLAVASLIGLYVLFGPYIFGNAVGFDRAGASATSTGPFTSGLVPKAPELDKAAYDAKMLSVANLSSTTLALLASTTASEAAKARVKWPVKNAPYPKAGALLPFNRIIAYYGNFYSRGMGVLGEYDEPIMLDKLRAEVAAWEAADPDTPVVPAIHYIVTTAQQLPQKDGMYTLRMPDSQIDKALEIAAKIDAIVFIDFQVGLSTLQKELPHYEEYLKHPKVHLGVDPEFSMKTGHAPGKVIGSYDAADINFAAEYLARLVRENDLPPKILVIHRFTQDMLTNTHLIRPLPEVQIVMDMDGWGDKAKKIGTYTRVIVPEPVQFTGFKLFYKNDLFAPSTGIFTPAELLKLSPQPIYIQYQ
jgi:hypothetical protein